jgi:chemotaxis signal transduction protein
MEQTAGGSGILQLVTFALGGEEYAVDILKVQEINRCPILLPTWKGSSTSGAGSSPW